MLLRAAIAIPLLWFAQPAMAVPECHQGESAREHAAHARVDTQQDRVRTTAAQRQQPGRARRPEQNARARADRPATSCGLGEDPFAMAPGPR